MERLTARELFEKVGTRLALRWAAGQRGESRAIVPAEKQSRRPSLARYLNIIYPNKIQINGTEELSWLEGRYSRLRREITEKMMASHPTALIATKDPAVPADLRDAAN